MVGKTDFVGFSSLYYLLNCVSPIEFWPPDILLHHFTFLGMKSGNFYRTEDWKCDRCYLSFSITVHISQLGFHIFNRNTEKKMQLVNNKGYTVGCLIWLAEGDQNRRRVK